jgi:hypothetical protein
MHLRQATSVLTMSQVSKQLLLPWPTSPHCRHQRCSKHQEVFGWQLGRVGAALQRAVLDPKDQLDSAQIIRLWCKTHADTLLGQGETVKHINMHPHIEAHSSTGNCTSLLKRLQRRPTWSQLALSAKQDMYWHTHRPGESIDKHTSSPPIRPTLNVMSTPTETHDSFQLWGCS